MITKRLGWAAPLAIAFSLAVDDAHADMFGASVQLQSGYADGWGVAGAQRDAAFHDGASGLSYGARAGFRIFLMEGWVEHNQLVGTGGLRGTWTQFMGGARAEFGIGDERTGSALNEDGEIVGAYNRYYGTVGLGIGYGVGTGQQVEPPLSQSQITDKGFVGQLQFGLGYRITDMFAVGFDLPIQGGYLFKGGEGHFANREDSQYQSIQASALLYFRTRIGF